MIYENAELEIVRFAAEDVLATSSVEETQATQATTRVTQDPTGVITTPDDEF